MSLRNRQAFGGVPFILLAKVTSCDVLEKKFLKVEVVQDIWPPYRGCGGAAIDYSIPILIDFSQRLSVTLNSTRN